MMDAPGVDIAGESRRGGRAKTEALRSVQLFKNNERPATRAWSLESDLINPEKEKG